MSMELPRAWSGLKRMGVAEEEITIVETASAGAESLAAARRAGTAVSVAAALAVPRNLRREMRESFMVGGSITERTAGVSVTELPRGAAGLAGTSEDELQC